MTHENKCIKLVCSISNYEEQRMDLGTCAAIKCAIILSFRCFGDPETTTKIAVSRVRANLKQFRIEQLRLIVRNLMAPAIT